MKLGECEQVAEFYELCNIAQYSTFKFCSRDPNFVDGARKKLAFSKAARGRPKGPTKQSVFKIFLGTWANFG